MPIDLSGIEITDKAEPMPDGPDYSTALTTAMEDFDRATAKHDIVAMGQAFMAAFEACENMPRAETGETTG